jgi:Trk-type K+ transport system membrane component
MSIKSYYRWALLLPLAVPALASPLLLVQSMPPLLVAVLWFLFWSVLIGGIPYVVFATAFLLWMRRLPEHRVRTGILLSPLVYAAVLFTCLTLFLLVDGSLANSAESLGGVVMLGLLFGYGYVGLAELGRAVLRPGSAGVGHVPVL